MADWIIILIGIVFILLIGWTVFFIIRRRKKKKKVLEIPNDILEDFQEAERRYKKSHGEKNPHTILYEIAKENETREMEEKIEQLTAQNQQLSVQTYINQFSDEKWFRMMLIQSIDNNTTTLKELVQVVREASSEEEESEEPHHQF
jgi:hypothetical protein